MDEEENDSHRITEQTQMAKHKKQGINRLKKVDGPNYSPSPTIAKR